MARKAFCSLDEKSELQFPITISQQALNLLRQIVSSQGWCRKSSGIQDMYVAGKLLVETLPKLEDTSWTKPLEEINKLSPEEKKVYIEKDEAWAAKQVSFTVTSIERDVIECAFNHFSKTAASAKRLGPNPHLFELIISFSIKDLPENSEDKAEGVKANKLGKVQGGLD